MDKQAVLSFIEDKRERLLKVNDSIWEYAETKFEEFKSSELLCKVLIEEGFSVKKGVADMDTAFVASYGSGKPVIAFLGEFDALPGLSQEAGAAEKSVLNEGGKGHGCGHNALGVGSLAAAIAVKEYIKETKSKGSIRYYGCPAEEGGSGKGYMARAGLFHDVDAAFTWHPGNANYVMSFNFLATICAYFKFTGRSSHAAAMPHRGRSALDAVELMNVGANFLREHVIPEARIHYAITDAGGNSPNVVQGKAAVLYQIRAPKMQQAQEIYDRVVKIAKGSAMMTDTQVEIVFDRAGSDLLPNRSLEKLLYEKFTEIPPIEINEQDLAFARKIRESLSDSEKNSDRNTVAYLFGDTGRKMAAQIAEMDIINIVFPYVPVDTAVPASTDVGDASWNMPTAQIQTTCYAKDTPAHSWQLVAQGKSELCHKALLYAGKVMALAGIELLENPDLLATVKQEFEKGRGREEYICPIPSEVKPTRIR